MTKAFNTNSLTVDDLQSNISLRDRKRIGEFFSSPSLSPFSFLETVVALKNAHGKKEKKRRRQMGKRRKEQAKTFSLLLLKEKDTTVRGGRADRERRNGGAKKTSLSHLMQMRRALTDKTCLARWNGS